LFDSAPSTQIYLNTGFWFDVLGFGFPVSRSLAWAQNSLGFSACHVNATVALLGI